MDLRLINRPISLQWLGWETDTYKLGMYGWDISAEQDVMYNRMRIAIRHPKAEVEGITEIEEYAFQDMMRNGVSMSPVLPVMLRFNVMGKQIFINQMQSPDVNFNPVDFQPAMIETEIKKLEDFANFTPIEVPTEQMYLREANMAEILKVAAERQEPLSEDVRKLNLEGIKTGKLHTELRVV